MKEVYSKYWITAREEIYGFTQYNRNLCSYISEHVPRGEKLLEVAIGTGYPFADYFQRAGYSVYGVDISTDLVQKCRKVNPKIKCVVGDAEDLPCARSYFGCTYCFDSTWYFPNLNKVIDEMLRVTRSPGLVIFDIQNRNARSIDSAYRAQLAEGTMTRRMVRYAKNMAKTVLRWGTPAWHFLVYEVPTYPQNLYQHFNDIGIADFQVMVRKADHTLESKNGKNSFKDYDRLIFVVEK